jgi:steroid delta-isomerase-like uncharacterized protein
MSARDVVKAYFEAMNSHDLETAASHLSDEVIEEVSGVGVLRGPREVREFFDGLFKAAPDMQVVLERTVREGDTVVALWRMTGTFTGGPLFNGVQATGGRIEMRGCDVIELSDGKIVRNTVYQDGLELARTLGLMPPQDSPTERAMIAAFNGATKLRAAVRDRFS